MKQQDSKQFREQIRILERKLGMLKKNNDDCCRAVTLPQCHALVEIGRAKSISLKELSTIISLDISTTSRTVDSLVKKEYVQRSESKTDRRSIEITLTTCGNQLFDTIESKMNQEFADIFRHIPENERTNVTKALDILIKAFHKI